MKKGFIYILCAVLMLSSVTFLVSCGEQEQTGTDETTAESKSSSSQAEEIVTVPTEKSAIADMFQAAINYVDGYCYGYTKSVKFTVSDLSVGALSSVSNSRDAFRSVFGETDTTADYNYNADKELFDLNFPSGNFKADVMESAKAEQKDGIITITAAFPNESDPKDGGLLRRLGGDYLSADDVKANLNSFASSAGSIRVSASDIKAVAKINASDSRLVSMEISFVESFTLSEVKLVKIDGASVSAKSRTIVKYTDIG